MDWNCAKGHGGKYGNSLSRQVFRNILCKPEQSPPFVSAMLLCSGEGQGAGGSASFQLLSALTRTASEFTHNISAHFLSASFSCVTPSAAHSRVDACKCEALAMLSWKAGVEMCCAGPVLWNVRQLGSLQAEQSSSRAELLLLIPLAASQKLFCSPR